MKHYSIRETLIADLQMCNLKVDMQTGFLRLVKYTLSQYVFSHGFACVVWYRLNRAVYPRFPRIARLIGVWRYYTFANDISYHAEIGPGFRVSHTSDIVIGAGVRIGQRCTIYNGVTLGSKSLERSREKPVLGDDVIVGTGAKILGNVTIGNGATIGALTFCDKSVPAHSIARGNPMVIVPATYAAASRRA